MTTNGVYPRVCGGTESDGDEGELMPGLSPRVRGNLDGALQEISKTGSIPACAGEPPSARSSAARVRVYPRVCGGTVVLRSLGGTYEGLSPRVRGNRNGSHLRKLRPGSIPACAGEPVGICPLCGFEGGLSPRVRGNREGHGSGHGGRGSIPACAGEPHHQMLSTYL